MKSLERIQQNSREINRMLARINTLVQERDASSTKRTEWQAACQDFFARYDALSFPGGAAMLARVRSGDLDALEAAVQFLLADPYHFRSGYLKERLWRWLARQPLSASARDQLEQAALAYLDRRICREFWTMCKTMARLGRTQFWSRVAERAATGDVRATLLLAYRTNLQAGAQARHLFYQAC